MNRRDVLPVGTLMAASAIIGAALYYSAPAEAAPIDDVSFLQTLDWQGITYGTASNAIGVAHEVCYDLDNGVTVLTEVKRLWLLSQLDAYNAGFFIGASEAAYCPNASSKSMNA